MDAKSIEQELTSFNDIENLIFEEICRLGKEMLKNILEEVDQMILETRDKKKYRYLRKQKREIRTKFGWVSYKRAYYRILNGEDQGENVFLLDELLEMHLLGKMTDECTVQILNTAVDESYRRSQTKLLMGEEDHISHETIKNKIDAVGELLKSKEIEHIQKYLDGNLNGEKEIPILFEEKDGLYLSIQGEKKERNKIGKSI